MFKLYTDHNLFATFADGKSQDIRIFELADQLTTLSYEHSDSLEIAAEAIESEIMETDFFSRNSETEGVLSKPQIISSSFNAELISSGQNSDAIELSDNHIVVLKVLELPMI